MRDAGGLLACTCARTQAQAAPGVAKADATEDQALFGNQALSENRTRPGNRTPPGRKQSQPKDDQGLKAVRYRHLSSIRSRLEHLLATLALNTCLENAKRKGGCR